ncbi:radical SAM protein [candidate division KSB1 bacterium]
MNTFFATYANRNGEIFDDPNHGFVACSAHHLVTPRQEEMIPLPYGAKFFTMPNYDPLGWNYDLEQTVYLNEPNDGMSAVSTFLPPGYIRLCLPGANYKTGESSLPLWSYTALAWKGNRFWVPAQKIDDDSHWNPSKFDDRGIDRRIDRKRRRLKDNRLVEQLAICAKEFHCFAAKNFFYERWECPLPVSPGCNAECVGCLSMQTQKKAHASMERLKFVPAPEEVIELALDHLERAPDPILSFGQGCEGDPLMQTDVIEQVIREVKRIVPESTININTNASLPKSVQRLADAGLDSIRISMNSALPDKYTRYYRPDSYTFYDVQSSAETARDAGVFVNLNLLVFPGITDQENEIDALLKFVGKCGVGRIQMKNLCIDPHLYLETVGYPASPGAGIRAMMDRVNQEYPAVQFGYFNLTKSQFQPGRQLV